MDFRRQIVTCLFSMLRLSFETQKVKENYAIFKKKPVKTGFFHIIILNLFEVSELPLFQKFNGSLDVLVHHPVLAVEWYDRAEFGQEVFQIC